jgi:peptidoglycan/LPS O-acetylase OafA/YrhL
MIDAGSIRRTHHTQSYRADVDGLRALAVIAVMLCHAGFTAFQGGFIGVDIFFTISGFVVTNSIVDDLNRNTFSFKDFYARRGKRLIPALYAMLVATFVFSLLFCVPEDTFRLGKNILAVATMTSNIFLAKQTGYFAPEATDQPLLHTWSLSVEEQFYVVLPLLLVGFYRKARKWTTPALATVAIASFAFAVLEAHRGSTGAYYFAHYRGFEFLIGSLLAISEKRRAAGKAAIFDAVFVMGIALILAGVLGVSVASQFPGLGAIVPCGGSADSYLQWPARSIRSCSPVEPRCRFPWQDLIPNLPVALADVFCLQAIWCAQRGGPCGGNARHAGTRGCHLLGNRATSATRVNGR